MNATVTVPRIHTAIWRMEVVNDSVPIILILFTGYWDQFHFDGSVEKMYMFG